MDLTPSLGREAWRARPPRRPLTRLPRPLQLGYQHHDAGPAPLTLDEALDAVAADQDYHQRVKRWLDLAYNGMASPTGHRIVGRGADWQGGATYGENDESLACCALGNYQHDEPTPELLAAIADTWATWVHEGRLARDFWLLRGHRDSAYAATACPGERLYAMLPTVRAMIVARLHALSGEVPDAMPTDAVQQITEAIDASLQQLALSILELDVRTQAPWPVVQLPGNATQYVLQTGPDGLPTLLVLPGPAYRDALVSAGFCEPLPRRITDADQAEVIDSLPRVRFPGR